MNLPEDDPNKIFNFKGWLKYYNMLDCRPLNQAISNSFTKFWECFRIDANIFLSLPSMAFKAMFNLSDKTKPAVVTFNQANDEVRQLFRDWVVGGMCNVYARDLNLTPDDSAENSKIAPNGLPFKAGVSFDFNAMYTGCEAENQPTTPGIRWLKQGSKYNKSIMTSGTSLAAQQWLYYLQETDFAKDDHGNKIQIQHKYFRGEHGVKKSSGPGNWYVDGYFVKNDVRYFLEFHGCHFHPGCCVPDEKIKFAPKKRYTWTMKKRDLESMGKLIVKRECQWTRELKALSFKPETEMPRILESDTEATLLDAIKTDSIYGFAVCDVRCPDNVLEKYKKFLFPPIIKHEVITEDHLSDYMRQRVYEDERKLGFETVVQVYNGQQLFLMTDIIKFYMEIGLEISNVTQFIQYIPARILKPFVDEVVGMRIAATREGDDTKQLTAKIFGNSCKFNSFTGYYVTVI